MKKVMFICWIVKNDMIISGGMNVYSTEVENAIQQCPGVGQVAITRDSSSMIGENKYCSHNS